MWIGYFRISTDLPQLTQSSSIINDFSRRYSDQMHQNQRSGITLSHLPSMVEVEDMLNKSKMQTESLLKIRETIAIQIAAYDQQVADSRQSYPTFTAAALPPTDRSQDGEDSKAGFAAADTKKRRGRAAPPGRCHSCNRAETPEWRRGPDGARTLCNACGLHYAKLTRKQNTSGKTAPLGSSNLRPKE